MTDQHDSPAPDAQFEQFWAAHGVKPAERLTIHGAVVTVPTDLPLDFERRAAELQGSEDPADVGELLTMLFGEDVFTTWADNGVTFRQFRFLLMWGVARGAGRAVSFEELWPEFERAEAEGPGKANRAARRAAKKAKRRR